MNRNDEMLGRMLSTALDWIVSNLRDGQGTKIAIYLGRKDDPGAGYLAGNMDPAELKAAAELMELDGSAQGMVNRDGPVAEPGS